MALAFADRVPSARELERLRLLLSSYQDGTGMLAQAGGLTLPGWRDFERSVAIAFNGIAPESKAVFDVLLSNTDHPTPYVGLSCKMRETLDETMRTGRVTIELSNAAWKFWQHITAKGIDRSLVKQRPAAVGAALVELIEVWHKAASTEHNIDLSRSSYLVLSWSKRRGVYQLHRFPLRLPDPSSLDWFWPRKQVRGADVEAERLVGALDGYTLFEWYGESGGQLKYYPRAAEAIWTSPSFQLEPLRNQVVGTLAKVAIQFPELWHQANQPEEHPTSHQ